MFPADFQERVTTLLTNGGPKFLIIVSVINILINLIVLKEALTNNILRKKGKIIALSVLSFMTAEHTISTLLALVNFIVILCLKRKNPEDYPEDKKEIPNIEYQKSNKKEIILTIILIIVYFSQFLLNRIMPEFESVITRICFVIGIYIVILAIAIFAFKDKLKRDIKLFKENAKSYYQYVLPRFGIMYVIFVFSSLICIMITKEATSVNQNTLESLPLWFTIPAAVLWAPIVEELLFRGAFRRFIKNDIIFIMVSAVVFGLLHTIGNEENILNTFVMAVPYAVLGGFLAYIYDKTDNLCNNILCHAFQNAFAMTMTTLLMFIAL